MNATDLFHAIGEVDAEKLSHCEQPKKAVGHRRLRFVGLIAAVVAILASSAMIVNAATGGALFGRLRIWINGEEISEEDSRVSIASEEDGYEIAVNLADPENETAPYENEVIAANDEGDREMLYITRSGNINNMQYLGMRLQFNHVEETDGKVLLHYGDDEIDLTEPMQRADRCVIDYTVTWDEGVTHLKITVTRDAEGKYSIATVPAN